MNNGAKVLVSVGPFSLIVLCVVCAAFVLTIRNPAPLMYAIASTGMTGRGAHPRAANVRPPPPRAVENASFYAEMMMEQKRRRALIDNACADAGMPRELDLGPNGENIFKSVGHLLVDDKYRVLFGFIPKVGCTTWKRVIHHLRATHRSELQQPMMLRGYKDNLTEITYRLQNYRKVLFVREPITRMLSAYLSKLKQYGNLQRTWERYIGRTIVRNYRGIDRLDWYQDMAWEPFLNITLAEYIQHITDIGSNIHMEELNDHWLPLHVVSNPCQIKYDFIGHYENLAVEAPFALHWLGVDTVIQFPEVHGSYAASSLVKEYSQVPMSLLKTLTDYYDFDYKAFGYRVNDTLSILMKGVFDFENDGDDKNYSD